jgi:hypothetical protein
VLVAAVTFTQRPAEASTVDNVSAWVTIDSVTAGATCPAISFLVGPYRVTADATTVYEGGMCTDLKPGATLRLEGTRLADDRVQAVRLSFTD